MFPQPSPFTLVIGTFASTAYIHLQLEARRRLYPDVPLLVHDDASPAAGILQALCGAYGAGFIRTPLRLPPCKGDLAAFARGLDWARGKRGPAKRRKRHQRNEAEKFPFFRVARFLQKESCLLPPTITKPTPVDAQPDNHLTNLSPITPNVENARMFLGLGCDPLNQAFPTRAACVHFSRFSH